MKIFNRTFFLFSILFSTFVNAKVYNIDLLIDSPSSKYLNEIKTQAKSLFSSSDKITYTLKLCDENCKKDISKYSNKVVLFKNAKKYNNQRNLYIISYNILQSKYEKDIFIRASALAIFEYSKEEIKTKSIYLKNKEILNNVKNKEDEISLKELNLKNIFSLALNNSLSIKQNKNNLLLNKLNIDTAKSDYKPKINLFSNYTQIDADRAEYSSGLYSEGTFNAGLKVSQLIYSNNVIQNIKIRKSIFKSTNEEIKALDDEVMYKLTIIYLNIIKAKKYNEIINIKHNFISRNLTFSKQRVSIGVQDRSDVYRWQSELANANIELLEAKKSLNTLKIELANILQLDYKIDFSEYGIQSELFKLLNKDAIFYIGNKKIQQSFINELVHTHSRLKQIKLLKNAKDYELNMNKDSRYLPTIAFSGSATKIIDFKA